MIFDPDILNRWQDVDPTGWRSLAREILDLFFSLERTNRVKLTKAIEEKDAEAISKEAHSFKSSCANVGAVAAYRMLQEIESHATTTAFADITAKIQKLEETLKETLVELHQYQETVLKGSESK
jgi:HPt (histidine-containing phosphotransfer) domain-containing protein